LYCALKTRRYEAIADLAINPEGSDALDMGDITASLGGGGLGFDQKLETQVRILKSDSPGGGRSLAHCGSTSSLPSPANASLLSSSAVTA